MKTTLLALLFSVSSFACPQLNGQYKNCRSVEGSDISYEEFSVVQRLDGKIHVFHISSVDEFGNRNVDTYKADGKLYEQEVTDEDTGSYSQYTTKTTCTKNEVRVESTIFSEKITVLMSKVDGKLVQKMNGHMLGQDFSATVVCD